MTDQEWQQSIELLKREMKECELVGEQIAKERKDENEGLRFGAMLSLRAAIQLLTNLGIKDLGLLQLVYEALDNANDGQTHPLTTPRIGSNRDPLGVRMLRMFAAFAMQTQIEAGIGKLDAAKVVAKTCFEERAWSFRGKAPPTEHSVRSWHGYYDSPTYKGKRGSEIDYGEYHSLLAQFREMPGTPEAKASAVLAALAEKVAKSYH